MHVDPEAAEDREIGGWRRAGQYLILGLLEFENVFDGRRGEDLKFSTDDEDVLNGDPRGNERDLDQNIGRE